MGSHHPPDPMAVALLRYAPHTTSDESRIGVLLDLSWLFFTKIDRRKWVSSFLELQIWRKQGSRSLGCSGTMFRRDGPRFPPGTGLVPEQNFIIPVFISLYILVPLAALQNPRCSPCDLADSGFGASFWNIREDFSLQNRACSGTFFVFCQ